MGDRCQNCIKQVKVEVRKLYDSSITWKKKHDVLEVKMSKYEKNVKFLSNKNKNLKSQLSQLSEKYDALAKDSNKTKGMFKSINVKYDRLIAFVQRYTLLQFALDVENSGAKTADSLEI